MSTTIAAANSAQKPRLGVSSVIFWPTVLITRQPHVAKPTTIPTPPKANAHGGTGAFKATSPDRIAW